MSYAIQVEGYTEKAEAERFAADLEAVPGVSRVLTFAGRGSQVDPALLDMLGPRGR